MATILTNPSWNIVNNPAIHCHQLPDGQPHVHEKVCAKSHPGHRVIAICGKGGVGKTAFSAMATHALLHRKDTGRLLVIDADPAFGLALALGLETDRTIAGVRERLLAAARGTSQEAEEEIAHELDYLVFESLVETDEFAFLAMGRSRDLGCYCSVNDLLRDATEMLAQEFDTVLIDGEAGLEQINRQVVASVDDLIIVSDGSLRGQKTVESVMAMAQEHDLVAPGHVHLVLNRQQKAETVSAPDSASTSTSNPALDSSTTSTSTPALPHLLGVIPADEEVAAFDRAGTPLLELPLNNPAAHAVQHIIDHLMG